MPYDLFDDISDIKKNEPNEVRKDEVQEGIIEPPSPDEPKPKKSGVNETAAALGVIFFFIAEIIGMAVFSQIYPPLCASCFGLILLIVGISGVKQTKITWESYQILIIPTIGALLVAMPILDLISRKKTGETIFSTDNIALMVSIFFFTAGFLLILMNVLQRHFMLKVCTEKITATCIALDRQRFRSHTSGSSVRSITRHRGSRFTYAPKWQYYFNGTLYETQESTHVGAFFPRVGEQREIFVNPNNPNQIYRNNPGVWVVVIPGGIIAMAISVLTVYYVFFKQ